MARVVFVESAFRHGYTEDDVHELLQGRYVRIRSQRGIANGYELFGRNLAGDYLHVVYRMLPDGRWRVFHIARMTDAHRRRYHKDTTMKQIKAIPPLPPDATDDEIIQWTEMYDLGARLDAGVSEIVEIHEPPQDKDHTTQLTLRIPSSVKAALQRLARRRAMNATTLAQLWITERLRQELKAHR